MDVITLWCYCLVTSLIPPPSAHALGTYGGWGFRQQEEARYTQITALGVVAKAQH